MEQQKSLWNFAKVNLAMFLVATSGPLGSSLHINPLQSIWWRAALSLIFLGGYIYFKRWNFKINSKSDLKIISTSGVLMALHWVTYFFALQWSGVALGMLSLFTYPVITALLEPFFTGKKLQPFQLFMALLICAGVYLIAPEFDFENQQFKGLVIGIISALFYALRNLSLKKQSAKYQPSLLMWYQMLITAIILIPTLFYFDINAVWGELPILLALAIVTTTIGHTMFISTFKYLSVSTASILSSVQPIYGILLGVLFLGEHIELKTIYGGVLILCTVALEGVYSLKKTK